MAAGRARLSVVTIGQAPRVDVTPELRSLLPGVELLEYGALDGLSPAEIAALRPAPGSDGVLTSRLRDGGSATFTHRAIDPLVRDAIARGEADGADATVVICSSHFPEFTHAKPLFFLEPLAHAAMRGILSGIAQPRLGVLSPLPEQAGSARERWQEVSGAQVSAAGAASPYRDSVETIADRVAELAATSNVVVLDCIGYSAEMAAAGRDAAGGGVPVLTVRALGASVLAAYLR